MSEWKVGDLVKLKRHYALKGTLGILVGIPQGFGPSSHGIWYVKWLDPATPLSSTCHESSIERVT